MYVGSNSTQSRHAAAVLAPNFINALYRYSSPLNAAALILCNKMCVCVWIGDKSTGLLVWTSPAQTGGKQKYGS